MKQGQFSQEQIVAILHQVKKGEQTIQAIFQEHGITETTTKSKPTRGSLNPKVGKFGSLTDSTPPEHGPPK